MAQKSNKLAIVHVRLFAADVATIKKIASQSGNPYQLELRQLVRRALKGELREVLILKETT